MFRFSTPTICSCLAPPIIFMNVSRRVLLALSSRRSAAWFVGVSFFLTIRQPISHDLALLPSSCCYTTGPAMYHMYSWYYLATLLVLVHAYCIYIYYAHIHTPCVHNLLGSLIIFSCGLLCLCIRSGTNKYVVQCLYVHMYYYCT